MKTLKFLKDAKLRMVLTAERFRAEAKGVAAIEFAIIAPLLIVLFFGTLEISTAVAVNRKVSRVSSTVGDLITQSQTLSESDVLDIMRSATYVMRPYDHTVEIVITGIEINDGEATVVWSRAQNGTSNATGSLYAVPDNIKTDGTFLVAAKVKTAHHPMIAFTRLDSNNKLSMDEAAINMEEEIFLRPRIGTSTMIE